MDFALFHGQILQVVAAAAVALNLSFSPPPQENLQTPSVKSENMLEEIIVTNKQSFSTNKDPQNLQNLSQLTQEDDLTLKSVIKKDDPVEGVKLITVDMPVIYTVIDPSPSPEAKEEKKPAVEIIKEAKAEEPSASPSPSPTATPTPTPSPSPSTAPVPAGNSNSEKLFSMVNDYRAKLNLKAFEKDERLCKMAQDRAPQVNDELASGQLHKGFKALNLPYWATENIAAYSSIEQDFNFWLSDYIHKKAIESDHKYSCVACTGASCSEIFTSFVSK